MSFKKKGKNQEIDARTVEDFISKLGPETQKFLQESSDGEGKSTAAKMKTTAHLGPNFGKPGYISPTQVVLVTGGGSGIGRLMCLRFARLGATVVTWDINKVGYCITYLALTYTALTYTALNYIALTYH